MTEMICSDEMSLGVVEMDASHRNLFDALTRMASVSDEEFGSCYSELVAKVEHDFFIEEERMEEIKFPGLKEHRERHASVLSALHHAAPRIMEGDLALGREIMRTLPQWFVLHISTMDRALADASGKSKDRVSSLRTFSDSNI